MNAKIRYLLKNVGILTISNFASKILIFFLVPIYTDVLSTEEVGIYDLGVSLFQVGFPVFSLNIVDAVMRFIMDKDQKKENVALIGLKYISIGLAVISIILAMSSPFMKKSGIGRVCVFLFFYYILNGLNQYLIQLAKGLEQVMSLGIAGILGTVIIITANLLFLLVFDLGLNGFFGANILGLAISVLYLAKKTRVIHLLCHGRIDKKLQNDMCLYCIPLIVTVVGWWINSSFDKFVVSAICGIASAGIISVAYKIPGIINTLQQVFIQAWHISAIKEYGQRDSENFYGLTFSVLNSTMVIICSLMIILTKTISRVLFLKDFFSAWQYVPFLLVSSVLNNASGFLGPILSAKKESKPMAMSAICGSIVNILINVPLVYLIGIQGATIATMISSFIIFSIRKNALGDSFIISNYYKVLISWGLLCVLSFIKIYYSIWWAECILFAGIVLNNHSELLMLLKNVKRLCNQKRKNQLK